MAVPSPFPAPSKSELRAEGLRRRKAFAASLSLRSRVAQEDALAQRILPEIARARVVALYYALYSEISPMPLLASFAPEQTWVLPWFADRNAPMMWRQGEMLEKGPWGVMQPSETAAALTPDVVIVPIVLADRAGARIGHGKGHYDRALTRLRERGPVRLIGAGWDCQIVDELIPADPWDVPLDAIATPKEWIICA